ncbi:hypothetical protein C5167_036737 [Papaver somniferum]|uniref:Replication protein A OB domain-containing protein n=1 Tax=Papaver somniferum TaxID=3469 RepID=A0A4Y7I6V7_PAPSO|nr:hypothetical protein C5167_036737 [Papaver somniferum]
MRDLTLKNLSGVNVKITMWGDSTRELSWNLDQHGVEYAPIVVTDLLEHGASWSDGYAAKTGAAKKHHPSDNYLPKDGFATAAFLLLGNLKSISELMAAKWPNGMPDDGWYYWKCGNRTTKLVREEGDQWAT